MNSGTKFCSLMTAQGKRMKPSEVSTKLRQIATAINNSTNPRSDLVVKDLRRILASIQTSDGHLFDEITVESTVTGTFDGKPFEAKLYWEPTTGDPADFELVSGDPAINPTDLLEVIQSGGIS